MELIKITDKNGQQVVSAKELHTFLEVKTPFLKWIEKQKGYGFEEKEFYTEKESLDIIMYHITSLQAKKLAFNDNNEIVKDIDILKIDDMYYVNIDCYKKVPISIMFFFWRLDDLKYGFTKNNKTYFSYTFLNVINSNFNGFKEIFKKKTPIKLQKTYLLQNIYGHVKIGKSIDPFNRKRTLSSNEIGLNVIAICDNNIEKYLHKKYHKFRMSGEWFDLTENIISTIIEENGFVKQIDYIKTLKTKV